MSMFNNLPKLKETIRGVAHIKNQTIFIIDLSLAIKETKIEDLSTKFIVITEYNGSIQGFLVV